MKRLGGDALSRWETEPNRVLSRRSKGDKLPPVATVVLNGREMTVRTILSLGWELPWIIYDQCTPSGVLDFVKDMPDVVVLRPSHPSSVAFAWNRCLREAWDRSADSALIVNNDIVFHPGAYENLLEVAREHPEIGILSMAELPEDLPKFRETTILPAARFSAFLQRRFVWDRLGGFDTRFRPAYWEDADYLRRIRDAGIPVGLTIRAACFHAHFGSTTGLLGRIRRNLYYSRNARRYVSKWGDARR